jgi:hypothetical protein
VENQNSSRAIVPKSLLLIPGTLIVFRTIQLGLLLTNVVRTEDYMVHTSTPDSDISIPIVNWQKAMQRHHLMISPN